LFIETPYRNEAELQALFAAPSASTRLSVSSGLTLPHAQTRSRLVKAWRQQADGPDNSTPAVFAIGR
jgi:16S rRNA (cytidine1402-2'-O)-methyltransferase